MPLTNLLENKFQYSLQTKTPISDVNELPYWEFEYYITLLNKHNEEVANQQRKQDEEQKKAQAAQGSNPSSSFNMSSIMNKFKSPKF